MIDFKTITRFSSLYNFHAHTPFCDGHAPMEDFIREAVKLNFTHFGFSPHSPFPYESTCNMSRADVNKYLSEIERLRLIYGSKLNIYASMEIDYTDEFGPSHEYFGTLPLDYKIGSIHFIPSFVDSSEYVDIDGRPERFIEKMKLYFHEDIESVIRSFYTQSLKMVEQGGFDVIGHFDKIGFNAEAFESGITSNEWYDKLVRELFDAIMDHGYVIEINTKAWEQRRRFYPNVKYFSWLKKYDCDVIINSDAHYPNLINSGRVEAMRLLSSLD